MLGLKLNLVSKRGHWFQVSKTKFYIQWSMIYRESYTRIQYLRNGVLLVLLPAPAPCLLLSVSASVSAFLFISVPPSPNRRGVPWVYVSPYLTHSLCIIYKYITMYLYMYIYVCAYSNIHTCLVRQMTFWLKDIFSFRLWCQKLSLNCDVIMDAITSEITSLTIVYSSFYSGADQRNIKAPRHWPLWWEFTADR